MQLQDYKDIETKNSIILYGKDTSKTYGISMLSSPINLGTPITTLASGSSSPELVNIGDVVVSLGDYFFQQILQRDCKKIF